MKTCERLHACDQTPNPIPILDPGSLTYRKVKRNREVHP